MRNTGNLRELLRTENGYLARGPNSVCEGDEVWVLYPAKIPCILRYTGLHSQYIFLGDAYVQGIMFGELITDRLRKVGPQGLMDGECLKRVTLV